MISNPEQLIIGGTIGVIVSVFLVYFYPRIKRKILHRVSTTSGYPSHGLSLESQSDKPVVLTEPYRLGFLNTYSPRVMEILKASRIIAATSSTVLIEGESGTGKEQIARVLHEQGPRAAQPFVAVHAAALPDTLLETELFGHEKGSFTGATAQRKGRFELADKGTLFLDEIGELPPLLQVKLLRVIQERSFERIGGNDLLRVDVRLIAATNRNLLQMVREKKFREDLYYRLNVVSLHLVPLRERKEDLPLLIEVLMAKQGAILGKKMDGFTRSFLSRLQEHDFPGNIRELENIIERAIVFSTRPTLDSSDIYFDDESRWLGDSPKAGDGRFGFFEKKIDREKVIEAYYRAHGNKAMAARFLGMRESTYRYHLKKAFETERGLHHEQEG